MCRQCLQTPLVQGISLDLQIHPPSLFLSVSGDQTLSVTPAALDRCVVILRSLYVYNLRYILTAYTNCSLRC
ncbi:hypothetical protein XENTR_v10015710 [Xenopus tropicalis]|nr:hypothetical protein XENTR_v10015710 [Xenopus tropicalis]